MKIDILDNQETSAQVRLAQYSGAVVAVFGLASVCWGLLPQTGHQFSAIAFLMTIVVAGAKWQRGPVLLMAVLSALTWNFLFIPPQFTFHISRPQDAATFVLFFVVALSMGQLIARLREREEALERHHAEREALLAEKHRADLLAESERLHRTLLDSISHELKTPIAVIRTALDSMRHDPAACTEEIATATRRLQRIVENFLEMTRVEADALTPRPEWCEIGDVLHAAVSPIEDDLRRHPLQVLGIAGLPLLRLDTRLLAQALGNLLHNAARHAPPGTPIEVQASLASGTLTLTVRDHGPGLPAEALPRVFDKFYRGPEARAGGTGLGLPIARGLLRALKGDITATNHPDGGACFTVSLPVETLQP